jgi:hypothetical protein
MSPFQVCGRTLVTAAEHTAAAQPCSRVSDWPSACVTRGGPAPEPVGRRGDRNGPNPVLAARAAASFRRKVSVHPLRAYLSLCRFRPYGGIIRTGQEVSPCA